MSKAAAISMRAKLGVTPPNTAGNAAEIAACYTEDNIRAFLANVAFRLRGDTPPLAFKWTALDPKKCLADQRYVLEQAIAEVTTDILQAEPSEKTK